MSDKEKKDLKEKYKFRPSARLIHTIGDQIIKDSYGAIVELVKNSFDADAKHVELKFLEMNDSGKARIIVKDDGHGMSFSTVTEKWMIPATDDKAERRTSPSGRNLQGRKGIGRFAVAILGDRFSMETTDEKGNTTSVAIDWRIFNDNEYLDKIEIPIETKYTKNTFGTELIIEPANKANDWKESTYRALMVELRKLVSPIKTGKSKNSDFEITVEFRNTGEKSYDNLKEKVEPFPLIDLFDYRLHGRVDEKGSVTLTYENQAEKNIPSEEISFKVSLDRGKYCGPINLDFRVFDRDAEAIDNLINRGLKDPRTGDRMGKVEARHLLDENCGISVYRGDFRIRPYGDAGYDWLELDKARVQNPSMKIGVDQIIGIVNISGEEESHLIEKSARDGLKESESYFGLTDILGKCLNQLEQRRFEFRRKTGRGRKSVKIEKELDALFDFQKLKKTVEGELKKSKVPEAVLGKIESIIIKSEKEKATALSDIKDTVAIYQGQVTVGKIIIVIMHEGRKPLKYLKEQSPRIVQWINDLKAEYNTELLDKIINRLDDTGKESILLIDLFNRLDPLAVKKRGEKKIVNMHTVVERVRELFNNELKDRSIEFINNLDKGLTANGWEQDFYITMTNLVDNSLYWLTHSKKDKARQIVVTSGKSGSFIWIDYRDSGPGIERKNIESNIIFEPGFSTKPEGTGLGLAISGEAIERNNGKLKAIYDEDGAYFRIELPEGVKK